MGKRLEFNFYMGLDGPQPSFANAVIEEASRLAGGCTVTFSSGFWIEGADEPQSRYTGPLTSERCFHLQMSVIPVMKTEIHYTMRTCIRREARLCGLDLGWVHVTTHEVDEQHFAIIPGATNDKRNTDKSRLSYKA